MPPNFHSILYDFFIKGHDLNYIAGTYETSWYEVAEILDSDLARKYMRSANRVQRIRAAGKAPGILTPDEKLAKRYLELGALFVAVGADIGLLARGSEALAAKFRG